MAGLQSSAGVETVDDVLLAHHDVARSRTGRDETLDPGETCGGGSALETKQESAVGLLLREDPVVALGYFDHVGARCKDRVSKPPESRRGGRVLEDG